MFQSILKKISTGLRMVRTYRNWPRLMAYRLNLRPQPMVVKCRDGSLFRVRDRRKRGSDAYVINESYLYGVHDLILPYLKRAKVCLDVGAYIGSFSIYAAKRSGARIFALEPVPETFELLKENISLNGLGGRVVPVQAALTGQETRGEVDIFVPSDSAFGSVSPAHLGLYGVSEKPGTIRVPAVTLARIFEEHRIDFCDIIKMDCEGAEYDVLYNTPADILRRIGIMTIEYHKDGDIAKLTNFLAGLGFEITRPSPEFAEIFCMNKNFRQG